MLYDLIPNKVKYGYYSLQYNADGKLKSMENRLEIIKRDAAAKGISLARQVHGVDVLTVSNRVYSPDTEADGFVTAEPGQILCVKTADCVPVLFSSSCGKRVGIVHAGWKGALFGVIESAVAALHALEDGQKGQYKAALGPHIRQASYEVSGEFYDQFYQQDPNNVRFFIPSNKAQHFLFDLTAYVIHRLNSAGIQEVIDSGINTYTDMTFPSYRRATHLAEPLAGHLISAIAIIG